MKNEGIVIIIESYIYRICMDTNRKSCQAWDSLFLMGWTGLGNLLTGSYQAPAPSLGLPRQ